MQIDLTLAAGASSDIDDSVETFLDKFQYNPPDRKSITAVYAIDQMFEKTIKEVIRSVPPSPDRTVALRQLRDAFRNCKSAISTGGRF